MRHGGGEHDGADRRAAQRGQRAEIAGNRQLAFFARLFQAALGGCFRAVSGAFAARHGAPCL
jgi:hypothetical protein